MVSARTTRNPDTVNRTNPSQGARERWLFHAFLYADASDESKTIYTSFSGVDGCIRKPVRALSSYSYIYSGRAKKDGALSSVTEKLP